MAALQAPQAMIQNSLLSYVRAQEDQADRAGVKFLTATGQSAKGMYDTFKRLADQILFQARYIDPYMQSHPMPAERVAALEGMAKASPYWDKKDPPALQQRHDLMRAKLYGFIDRPEMVARRYPLSDHSLPARYARAIAAYRFGNLQGALAQIDALIHAQPQNPYFHELKGQALLEAGKPAEAIAPLRRAVQLAPNAALIQIMLAQALLATNNKAHAEEALAMLEDRAQARARIPRRLQPDRHGLWPQRRPRPCRSRLRAGRIHARRPADRAPARGARQDPFPGRLAGLGEGRRHRHLQGPKPEAQMTPKRMTFMKSLLSPFAGALLAAR